MCKVEIEQDTLILHIVDITSAMIDAIEMIEGILPSHLLGSVTVFSGSGDVQDVLIDADGSSVNPDEHGYYGLNLDPGLYDVTVSLEGYETQLFEDVEILYGTETTVNITIYETSIGDTGTTLLNSHPNPFGEQTEILYQISAFTPVQLKIFDISGHQITVLVDDQLSAGDHSVIWNGTDDNGNDVSSGVYFIRLTTGIFTATESCILIR